MELIKFYEKEDCQCFKISSPTREIKEMFNNSKFLFIFYYYDSVHYEYTNNFLMMFEQPNSFFYMFSFEIIPMNKIFGRIKLQPYKKDSVAIPTNRFGEYIKDDNMYLIPLAKNSFKSTFQILDKQLIKITSEVDDIDVVIKEYNKINKKKPIKIINIIKSLMNGFGIDEYGCMIHFVDTYNENVYKPLKKESVKLGYNFRSKCLKDEVNQIIRIEKAFENMTQEIELYPTFNHSLKELVKIKGAKETKRGSIKIRYSDLLNSGIKWKITDFIS